MAIVVKVGQVWIHPGAYPGKSFKITRIDSDHAYHVVNGTERSFGQLNQDGTQCMWSAGWLLVPAISVVKVGQVWKHEDSYDNPQVWKITSIRSKDDGRSVVFAADISRGMKFDPDQSQIVGYIEVDGRHIWPGWYMAEDAPIAVKSGPTYMDDMTFFKATAPGNCVCNIPKSECTYHR